MEVWKIGRVSQSLVRKAQLTPRLTAKIARLSWASLSWVAEKWKAAGSSTAITLIVNSDEFNWDAPWGSEICQHPEIETDSTKQRTGTEALLLILEASREKAHPKNQH